MQPNSFEDASDSSQSQDSVSNLSVCRCVYVVNDSGGGSGDILHPW